MEPPKLKGYEYDSNIVGNYIQAGRILILYLAYNSQCNLSCPFCFSNGGKHFVRKSMKQTRNVKELRFDDLIEIIDQGIELGIKSVCFYGEGEPLLKSDLGLFFKLVDYVNKKNLIPVVFTNGVTMTPTIAKKLYNKNVSVVGKLYSFKPKVNEFLTGCHGIYEYKLFKGKRVPSHIPNLMNVGYNKGNRFALFTVVTKYNYEEIENIWKWERSTGIIPYVDFLYTYRHQRRFGISESDRQRLCKSIYDYDKSLGFDYEYHLGSHIGHRICNTRIAAVIGVNGEVRLCPAVDVYIGNVRKNQLADLLIKRANLAEKIRFKGDDKGKCGAYRLEERRSQVSQK